MIRKINRTVLKVSPISELPPDTYFSHTSGRAGAPSSTASPPSPAGGLGATHPEPELPDALSPTSSNNTLGTNSGWKNQFGPSGSLLGRPLSS